MTHQPLKFDVWMDIRAFMPRTRTQYTPSFLISAAQSIRNGVDKSRALNQRGQYPERGISQ
jgi:hypothetical protein